MRLERNFRAASLKGEYLNGDENSAAVKCDTRLDERPFYDLTYPVTRAMNKAKRALK